MLMLRLKVERWGRADDYDYDSIIYLDDVKCEHYI